MSVCKILDSGLELVAGLLCGSCKVPNTMYVELSESPFVGPPDRTLQNIKDAKNIAGVPITSAIQSGNSVEFRAIVSMEDFKDYTCTDNTVIACATLANIDSNANVTLFCTVSLDPYRIVKNTLNSVSITLKI